MGLKGMLLRLLGRRPTHAVFAGHLEEIVVLAAEEAAKYGSRTVDLHHVVLALTDETNDRFRIPPDFIGPDRAGLRQRVVESLRKHQPPTSREPETPTRKPPPIIAPVAHVLRDAQTASGATAKDDIQPELILREIVRRKWPPSEILREHGILPDA